MIGETAARRGWLSNHGYNPVKVTTIYDEAWLLEIEAIAAA